MTELVKRDMTLRRELTLVLPHFQNLGMWAEQQRVMDSYPEYLRSMLHVVLVDDCSPKGQWPTEQSVRISGLASVRIYRLTEKKRWNWLACRNLGAKVATTDWLLLTDIDHVMPSSTLWYVLKEKLDERSAYRFSRVTATKPWPYKLDECEPYKEHNDSWLLTRALFFDHRVGGYDERLSGCYGSSGEFRDRLVSASKQKPEPLKAALVRYPREIIADASTHPSVYTRKGDPENDAELRRRKLERAKELGWRPLHGLTPYVQVYATAGVCAA
jgi:hypothetical protein